MPNFRSGSSRYGSEPPQDWPAVGKRNRRSPGDNAQGILEERLLNPKYFTHFERFMKLPQLAATIDQVYTTEAARACNTELELDIGNNAADGDITFRPGGGVNIETVATDGNNDILQAHGDAGPYTALAGINWSSARRPLFYANIVTGPAADDVDNVILWFGYKLTNTPTTITDADQFFFRMENDVVEGDWQCVTSVNGTDTETDSNVNALTLGTNFRLMVEVDRDRVPHFWINDAHITDGPALRDLATFEFFLGIEADGDGNDKAYGLRNFIVSQLIS